MSVVVQEERLFGRYRALHAAPSSKTHPYPILCVHGFCGSAQNFGNFIIFAALNGWDAWALNLRGHHKDHPVDDLGNVSLSDYVQDVYYALLQLRLEGKPAILLGHSMGGLISQIAASRYGHLVRALVLVASASAQRTTSFSWPLLWRTYRPGYVWARITHKPFTLREDDVRTLILNRIPAEEQKVHLKSLTADSGLAASEVARLIRRKIPMDNIDTKKCPVLVVAGDCDRTTSVGAQKKLAARHKANYFLEVLGGGHALLREPGWQKTATQILKWVEAMTKIAPPQA